MFIRRCHEIGLIDQRKMNECFRYISEEKVHVELRNLILMILLPKKLHVDDSSQGAYLRAAVSRVSFHFFIFILFFILDCQSNRHGATWTRFLAPYLAVDATG